MAKFCPICKAQCGDQCALYHERHEMCIFQVAVCDIGVIAGMFERLAAEKKEEKEQ